MATAANVTQISLAERRVPDVVFKTRVRDESIDGPNPFRWHEVTSTDIFSGKRVVLFALRVQARWILLSLGIHYLTKPL